MPKLTINGIAVEVAAGATVLQACQQAGILKVGFLTEPQGFENSDANAVSSVL